MKIIDRQLLDGLTDAARENRRLRQNWNLHTDDDFPAHRLLNAMEPDSYIRPHRHLDPMKDETFMVVRGRLGVVLFADEGSVTATMLLEACGEVVGVDIPSGCFHTVVSLEAGAVFFEAKAGPYRPLTAAETAPWAPAESSPQVAAYLESLKNLF